MVSGPAFYSVAAAAAVGAAMYYEWSPSPDRKLESHLAFQ